MMLNNITQPVLLWWHTYLWMSRGAVLFFNAGWLLLGLFTGFMLGFWACSRYVARVDRDTL